MDKSKITNSKLIRFLTRRYLRFDRSQPFISIAAILAFLGVGVGVMVLIVAMALMNGFDKEFERKLFTMNYPLTIFPLSPNAVDTELLQNLQQSFPKLTFSPFLQTQAISKTGNLMEGAMVFGVDFTQEIKINEVIATALKNINLQDLQTFDIVIGKELQKIFHLSPNSKLLLIFTTLEPNALSLAPTTKRFNVAARFESGLLAYDKAYVYTSIEALRLIKHLPKDVFDGIHIYSSHPEDDIKKIESMLPSNVSIIGWWQQNGNFFAALQLEKRALFIVLMLIILVASLNIISSLLMTVMNRRREIALLLTMGCSKQEIFRTFMLLGNTIGLSGVLFGSLLAAILLLLLANFPIISLPADVYGSSKLPLELSLVDLGLILGGSIAIVFFSTYYPAKKATQIDPLQVLRNE